MPAAVILSGGFAHPFDETSAWLAERLAAAGLPAVVHGAVADALADLPGARLLLVNALWWSMTQDEKYAPHRNAHAGHLADAELQRIAGFVAAGGGLFAFHAATICWDTQPGWRALIGGGWTWGRSWHPPLGPVEVALTAAGAALSAGAARFALVDECYHALDPAPDCRLLAEASAGSGAQPVAWQRRHGGGRVAVDALGHDLRSLQAAGHAALIDALVQWTAGEG